MPPPKVSPMFFEQQSMVRSSLGRTIYERIAAYHSPEATVRNQASWPLSSHGRSPNETVGAEHQPSPACCTCP